MPRAGSLARLSARQAAAQLGVKVETIYAYVSRGVLERIPGADGRTSFFDASQVESLARKRTGRARRGGVQAVLGTELTEVAEGGLSYRGLPVGPLAGAHAFEEVAEWLWLGPGPERRGPALGFTPWQPLEEAVAASRAAVHALPEGTGTAERLRVIAASSAPCDPMRFDLSPGAAVATARRLIAALVEALPARGKARVPALRWPEREPIDESLAQRLWPRLSIRRARPESIRVLNAALVLIADHGLAASTFAARVAASVRADPCSIVNTGLGTLSGPLHGAASAGVHRLLSSVGHPDRAVAALGEHLRRESVVPGFGHLIYRDWDPRARVLHAFLADAGLDAERVAVAERILQLLLERTRARPNIDFLLGAFSYAAEMDEDAGETLFGVARAAGWIAHALEEYREPELRFRPRAHYVGPLGPG